jgi:hypothetical protein
MVSGSANLRDTTLNILIKARSIRCLIVDAMTKVTTDFPLPLYFCSITDIVTVLFLLLQDPGDALRKKILYLALEYLAKKLGFHALSLTSLDSAN